MVIWNLVGIRPKSFLILIPIPTNLRSNSEKILTISKTVRKNGIRSGNGRNLFGLFSSLEGRGDGLVVAGSRSGAGAGAAHGHVGWYEPRSCRCGPWLCANLELELGKLGWLLGFREGIAHQ
jgi:hypothetical protein